MGHSVSPLITYLAQMVVRSLYRCVVLFERADLFYVIFGKYVDYGGGFLFTGKDFMGN